MTVGTENRLMVARVWAGDGGGGLISKAKPEKLEGDKTALYPDCSGCYKWFRCTHLQSRNRDTNVDNTCTDTKEEGELGDWN